MRSGPPADGRYARKYMIAIANTRIALQPTKSSLTSRLSIASPPKERADPLHSSFPG
jgi:hypothetical protein